MNDQKKKTRITLTDEEVSIIQDALHLHPTNDPGNILSDEDRYERDLLRQAKTKIDRAYQRVFG